MNMNKNTTPSQSAKGCLTSVLIIGILAIFIRACFFSKNKSDDPEQIEKELQRKREARNIEAFSYAEVCVKKNLKSPSSAEFDMFETKVWEINDSTYMVKGPVDSQNSFGAMIRTYFECELTISNDGTFKCGNVTIIE